MPRLRTRKGQWLLALLCLKQGAELGRDWIAATLWPDSDSAQAYANLRLALHDLRRALDSEARRVQAPTIRTLRFDPSGCTIDIVAFDAAAARGDAASLGEAVALYRGRLLEECADPWVDIDRDQREQACLSALGTLAQAALDRADAEGAENYLRRARQMDPLRETTHCNLMRALAMRGDIAAATQVYRELRVLLREELNVEPSPATLEVYRGLRAGRSDVTSPDSPGRSAARPERQNAGPAPRRLPRPLTEFIGREREVERVASFVLRNRLVTLTGPGGIGKTRLAIEVAQSLADAFPDGISFADLAPVQDGSPVASVIASAAGAQVDDADDAFEVDETVIDALAGRESLIVVDSCEHVVGACAEAIEALLSGAPNLHVLATSRQALGITSETDWRVQPLSLAGDGASAGEIANAEAVKLFMQRAQSVRPDFGLSEANAGTVARVCARLDGIPLAVELAAARLKILSVEQVAAKLDDRFELLSAGSRTALPRHRTLEATLDWSFALLSDSERLLLTRLSVFPGRFDLEAADAVCGHELEETVLDLLGRLADKSLVSVEEYGGEALYRLLESTRAYARAKLGDSQNPDDLMGRHAAYFLAYAEHASPLLMSPQAPEWLDRLEMRSDDFRPALAWFSEQRSARAREEGLRLANALWPFWRTRHEVGDSSMGASNNVWSEAVVWLEKLLGGDPPLCAATALAQVHLATLAMRRDMPEQAKELFGKSLAICESLGDLVAAGSTLRSLAVLHADAGDMAEARSLLSQSLEISRRSGNRAELAQTLTAVGSLSYQVGDIAGARQVMEEALGVQREVGHPLGISAALTNIGVVALAAGDLSAAQAAHEESLAINEGLKHTVGIAWSLDNLAEAAIAGRDMDRACSLYRSSVELFHALGHRSGMADCLVGVAEICLSRGEADTAARLLSGASALRHRLSRTSTGDRERFKRLKAATDAALGTDSGSLSAEGGNRMSLDEALCSVTEALDSLTA